MDLYHQSRTCKECDLEESRELPPLVAAFEERRRWVDPCMRCGSTRFSSSTAELPPLDVDIMEEWVLDEQLCIMDQDEEIIMADPSSFDLLTRYVQRRDIPRRKRTVLFSALCVLVYDRTPRGDDPPAELGDQTASSAIQFLKENRWLFQEINDGYISGYIKSFVYPLIGMSTAGRT